jgi:hypothetical protein
MAKLSTAHAAIDHTGITGVPAAGSVATDTIWDAAGDLAVGSGANTAAKLTKGTALQVLRVNSGATNLEWATPSAGTSFTGNVIIAAPIGLDFTQTGSGGTAGTGYMMPISIPGSMQLRKLRVKVQSGAAGTVEWGLFDYSSNAAACTKLAGGSGAIATNWADIAATSAPVAITAGNYILIIKLPAATAPSLVTCSMGTSANLMKSQASYAWDDTPDLTTGWTDSAATFVMHLEGDIDGSNQW